MRKGRRKKRRKRTAASVAAVTGPEAKRNVIVETRTTTTVMTRTAIVAEPKTPTHVIIVRRQPERMAQFHRLRTPMAECTTRAAEARVRVGIVRNCASIYT